ncbi:phosphoesterase [Fervidicella metallireducens AeB]|uniref:protein-tyrosine-phosphatase n=1 Tax=Fervidicella metallireducens AeB TaxID=1403537 RepID=A0A017RYK3_9CLOT|nr:CpsB/CapC family capsule biosynthesis tyrosine phosphatase [Fervidicella metallireducens]EYE89479.1 phosphoesterase [Fervidicella metallireducens AeB]
MIDIHCHILPGIDDGAKDLDGTIEMLKIAEGDGIKTIIATPHYFPGYFETPYDEVVKLTEMVNKKTRESGIEVEIYPGQEIFLNQNIIEDYRNGIIGKLWDTDFMLIELPVDEMPKNTIDLIYELRIMGITPIIAHPERYRYIIEKPQRLNEFLNEGCHLQINAGSLTGLFGREVKKTAERIVENRACSFIATDAHTTGKRSPELKKSFDIISRIDKELIDNLILSRESLKKFAEKNYKTLKIKEKKSIFSIFNRK